MAVRDRPHLILTGPVLRGCLKCMGSTRNPYPAPMIHESSCKTQKNVTFEPPENWLDLVPREVIDPCARCGHSAEDHGGGPGEGEYPDLPCDCGCDRWTEEGSARGDHELWPGEGD